MCYVELFVEKNLDNFRIFTLGASDVFPYFSCFGGFAWLACLWCDHQSSVAFIVLVIYVYEGAAVKPVHNVDEAFAARHHQAVLLGGALALGLIESNNRNNTSHNNNNISNNNY